MQSQALPIDWIFQPSRWQPARRLAEWLRHWAARKLDRREAPRKTIANLLRIIGMEPRRLLGMS